MSAHTDSLIQERQSPYSIFILFIVYIPLLLYRIVEHFLGRFVDENKAKQLKEKSMPVEGCAVVAGRTDKGVTALQQVCSFC